MPSELVTVTGGSGFIGAHAVASLLQAGYRVRTTLRSITRVEDVHAMLTRAGIPPEFLSPDRLAFVAADLRGDQGWAAATAGAAFVLHVASPFPAGVPHHEDELILPARAGTLRVLRAARDAGVRRVVMTSSFAAIGYGHPEKSASYDESTWTNPDGPGCTAYVKSKTLAERDAWDFIAREGGSLELAVINPVGVFGPILAPDFAASVLLVQRLMDGSVPGCPRIRFGVVDVRDVVDLHLRAMLHPAAAGQRFLAIAGHTLSMFEVAQLLHARLGHAARRVPTRQLPDIFLRAIALFDKQVRQIVPELGKDKNATAAKAETLLDWHPRPREEALLATAESLLQLGVVQP